MIEYINNKLTYFTLPKGWKIEDVSSITFSIIAKSKKSSLVSEFKFSNMNGRFFYSESIINSAKKAFDIYDETIKELGWRDA